MEQGDIILVRYPFSNVIDYKIRPALVVSNSEFNRKFDRLVCPITSKRQEKAIAISGSLAEGKLDRESFAKTNAIATIENDMILKKIGKVSGEKTAEIIGEIIKNF